MAGFVGLPVELVQIISGCMTLRDWARASGTCKAWWKLPLIKLELCKAAGHESKLTSAGIKWVSKHGHSVQLLVLDLENLAVNSLGELQPLSEIFVGRGINELHLLGSVTTPSLKIPVATTPTHPMGTGQLSRKLFHYIMRYAAAMATALRVLQCHLEYLDPNHGFPVMRHLEHVVLRVASEVVLPKLAAALPHMRQMQTVHLYNPLHRHVGWNMPSLNLMKCTNLQSIRLGGIAPAGLHLPSSCTVHLDPMSWELACAPVWASLHSVGFLFYDQEGRATPEAHGGDLSWLDGPVQLDIVCLENITKETALALPAGIAGARHVVICGNDVHLHITAKNSWKIIEVHACGDLSFDFEDVSAFARNAPAFTVEFVNPKGLGVWNLLKAMGGSWDMRTFSQSTIDFFHLCNRCIDDLRCNFMEDYFENIQHHGGIQRLAAICKCGACAGCLTAAQVLAADFAIRCEEPL